MKKQNDYKHWNYQLIRYIPVTPKGGGEIEWKERYEYRNFSKVTQS